MGSQPQLLLPQDVSAAQVQSQSQPFPTWHEVNNTELDQKFQFCVTILNYFEVEHVLSQKMKELSSQDIEIEAGFCGDFDATVTHKK